ncbi:hypothetical protein ISCGN_014235 [Ixodes scapularis]
MPGGRNSGAVYNLYKVKYKKHKKGPKNGQLMLRPDPGSPAAVSAAAAAAAKSSALSVSKSPLDPKGSGTLVSLAGSKALVPLTPSTATTTTTTTNGGLSSSSSLRYQQSGGNGGGSADWVNGGILKTALTSPSEVMHLRHAVLEQSSSASRVPPSRGGPGALMERRSLSAEQAAAMIDQLIECDDFEDVATLNNMRDLLNDWEDLSRKLRQIADKIVHKLVQWTKRLPFYAEIPLAVHTQLLAHKWHELVVLTTAAYQAIQLPARVAPPSSCSSSSSTSSTSSEPGVGPHSPPAAPAADVSRETAAALCELQRTLAALMGQPVTLVQLPSEALPLVDQMTGLASELRRTRLCLEEYVCLKVVIMLSYEDPSQRQLEAIQERYLSALRVFTETRFPNQGSRFADLLARLPEIQAAAALLLHSKMFYVPFLLNSSITRYLRYQQSGGNGGGSADWVNGGILKTALTSPSEVMHLRHAVLEQSSSASRVPPSRGGPGALMERRSLSAEQAAAMIDQLIECDDFEDVATLNNMRDLLNDWEDLSRKLRQIADKIVHKLVQWTKRLPFYAEIPLAVHTQLLAHKWHELVVLTTAAYQAIQLPARVAPPSSCSSSSSTSSTSSEPGVGPHSPPAAPAADVSRETAAALCELQRTLAALMGQPVTLVQLPSEALPLVDQMTGLASELRRTRLCLEEYVCLKVVIMLSYEDPSQRQLEAIQERYLSALRVFTETRFPNQGSRFADLLARLPEIQAAAALLLHSKMFYVPFLLNSSITR